MSSQYAGKSRESIPSNPHNPANNRNHWRQVAVCEFDITSYTKLCELACRTEEDSTVFGNLMSTFHSGVSELVLHHLGMYVNDGGDSVIAAYAGNDGGKRAVATARHIAASVEPSMNKTASDFSFVFPIRIHMAADNGPLRYILDQGGRRHACDRTVNIVNRISKQPTSRGHRFVCTKAFLQTLPSETRQAATLIGQLADSDYPVPLTIYSVQVE